MRLDDQLFRPTPLPYAMHGNSSLLCYRRLLYQKNHFAINARVRALQRLVNVYRLFLLLKYGLVWAYFTDTNLSWQQYHTWESILNHGQFSDSVMSYSDLGGRQQFRSKHFLWSRSIYCWSIKKWTKTKMWKIIVFSHFTLYYMP